MLTQGISDSQARRAAKRVGLAVKKTRWRANTVDNKGGYQIIDPNFNRIEAGERFDLSAKDVVDFCTK